MIKKTKSNFKLCSEDIILKFNHLIAPYSFTAVLGLLSAQLSVSFFLSVSVVGEKGYIIELLIV
jgi:hypothetical protein